MNRLPFFQLLLFPLLAMSSVVSLNAPLRSQPVTCTGGNSQEPPATNLKTIRLDDFGIQVRIPSNYRAMKKQDGSVQILHPDDYDFIQCIVAGGRGGRGLYSQIIKVVERDSSMSLQEQAKWAVGYSIRQNNRRVQIAGKIIEYDKNQISGYIVASRTGNSAVFSGMLQDREQVLEVSAGCDCPVEINDVVDLLSRIEPLS